jgi:hypothetical protein
MPAKPEAFGPRNPNDEPAKFSATRCLRTSVSRQPDRREECNADNVEWLRLFISGEKK